MTNHSFTQSPHYVVAHAMYDKGMKRARQEVYDKLASEFKEDVLRQVREHIIETIHAEELEKLRKDITEQVTRIIYDDAFDKLEKELGSLKNKDSVVMFPNLSIIYEKDNVSITDYEIHVKNVFERMGYQSRDCRFVCGGHPDWIFTKDMERIYVEVKSPTDGLRPMQGAWILKHPDKKVIIYYIGE